jgi:hypothetical protein
MGDAEAAFRQVWELQQQSVGAADASTLTSLARVAYAEDMQGKDAHAEAHYLEALEGLEAAVGWVDGNTNHTATNLLQLLRGQGRIADAETVVARLVGGLTGVFGADDPRTLMHQMTLAELLLDQGGDGKRGEAQALLEGVIERMEPRHPNYMLAFQMHQRILDGE